MKKFMLVLVRELFSKTPLLKWIDGRKSEIGLLFTAAYFICDVLIQAVDIGCAECGPVALQFREILELIKPYLIDLGVIGLSVGVAHNYSKEQTLPPS